MRAIFLFPTCFATLMLTACMETRSLRPEMTIQVKPTGSDSYLVQGQTSLPGETTVLVQAVRQLQPTSTQPGAAPVYTIVAREQTTTTADGTWNTKLKRLQPQTKGPALESWQQNAVTQAMAVKASPELQFIATTAPISPDLRLEGDVDDGNQSPQVRAVLQVDTDGNRFLQAKKALTVPPPNAPQGAMTEIKRTVVKVPVKPIAATDEDATRTEASKSDAPLRVEEFVR